MANRMKQLLSGIAPQQISKPFSIKVNGPTQLYGDGLALQAKQAAVNLDNARAAQYKAQAGRETLAAMSAGPEPQVNGYYNKLFKVESGGKWDAVNKGSGAYGIAQFIPSTMKAYASKLGMSIEQAKTPAGQMKMLGAFTQDNAAGLKRAGIPVNDTTLYMAHQQGLGGAIKMYKGGQPDIRNLLGNGVSSTQQWFDKFGPMFR